MHSRLDPMRIIGRVEALKENVDNEGINLEHRNGFKGTGYIMI